MEKFYWFQQGTLKRGGQPLCTNSNARALGGGNTPRYMGLEAAMGVSMGTRLPVLSPNDDIAHHGVNVPPSRHQ